MEELVALYPKPEYWQNALAPLVRMDIKDSHLQLNVYRLMNDVGVLKLSSDYADMAEIALDQGYPGEAVSVLQEAFQKNVFSEQRDSTCSIAPNSARLPTRLSWAKASRPTAIALFRWLLRT